MSSLSMSEYGYFAWLRMIIHIVNCHQCSLCLKTHVKFVGNIKKYYRPLQKRPRDRVAAKLGNWAMVSPCIGATEHIPARDTLMFGAAICTLQVALRSYCPVKDGGNGESNESTVSDAIVRSWLWSTSTLS